MKGRDGRLNIEQAFKSLKGIKLKGGIFGKVCVLLMVLSVCLTGVCLRGDVWWLPLALLIPFMAMVFYALKRCFDFAEKHPVAAIVDGAELVAYEQATQGRKGQESLPPAPYVVDHQITPIPSNEVMEADVLPANEAKKLGHVNSSTGEK